LYQLVPKTHHIDETEFGSSDSLLPTPTTQEIEHPEATLTKNNRRLSKDGKSSHSLNLADTMNLWPTPNAWDAQRGPRSQKNLIEKNHQINLITAVKDAQSSTPTKMWPTPNASPSITQTVGGTIGLRKRNRKQGQLMEAVVDKMFPTPTATEARQGYQDRTKGKLGTQKSLSTEIIDSEGGRQATVGQLNSEWVTWLMGYPQGYLDISTENQNTSQELQQEKKTEPKS
jgi:hypothetical protein